MKTRIAVVLMLWGAGPALGCAACEDRDALQQSFTSTAEAEAAAAAAAQSSQPAAPEAQAPPAPRERLTVEASAPTPLRDSLAPRKKPNYIRSFNELR